jgi:hypothetical protein
MGCDCVDRDFERGQRALMDLFRDYEGKGLICVDVDNTIFGPAEFPFVGEPLPGVREVFHELRKMGYKIIIWSGRNSSLVNVPSVKWIALRLVEIALQMYGIEYDAVDYGYSGKIPCEFYIDDHAIGFRGDWWAVLDEIKRMRR